MYPTKQELERISDWSFQDFQGLMTYVKSLWKYSDQGYWKEEGNTYYLSTAGWSGNEDIIKALKNNAVFWNMCWELSKRGGYYIFKLPDTKEVTK